MFEGRNIAVHKGLALFITMNPTYEFRNVLPSNLKVSRPFGGGGGGHLVLYPVCPLPTLLPPFLHPQALFRPVAMMVPDYRLIAEVSLYANGFRSAASLATNLVSVLKVRGAPAG